MITGMVPEDAMERWISDRLTDLQEIYGTGLTPAQAQAVMKGLAVKKEDRYENLTALCEALYGEKDQAHAKLWFRTEELPHQILSGHTQTLRKEAAEALQGKNSTKKAWTTSVLTLTVILIVAASLWFALGKEKIHGEKSMKYRSPVPAATQEAVEDIPAPSDRMSKVSAATDVEKTAEPAKASAKTGKSTAGQKISKENLLKKLNKKYEVLIEDISFDGKYYIGRTMQDVPEIDGIVYVKNDKPGKNNLIGKFVECEIKEVSNYDLIANYIKGVLDLYG